MLSTVSWKGFGGGGASCICAGISCGKINDKTQSTRPALRRCLAFMLVIIDLETAKPMVRVFLISTLLQQGVKGANVSRNRFNGLSEVVETAHQFSTNHGSPR